MATNDPISKYKYETILNCNLRLYIFFYFHVHIKRRNLMILNSKKLP